MLTISKALSAGQARRYHAEEFQNTRENYYAEGERIVGTWHGQLAAQWGLLGHVREEHFQRLADGQHPLTGAQLVQHRTSRRSRNNRGETITTMEHRAGWDATFSAPKSVSLTALVGRDPRIRAAHEASVDVALRELERYVQARLGGNLPAQTTGKWVAAKFDHDSSRPVKGYAAPQLHTHVVVFNLTETEDGTVKPLQPRELYKTQQYATAVYRSELAKHLRALGYAIERGAHDQPEIVGYSPEYLEASSPRRTQITEHLAREQQHGPAAAQIAAHETREEKLDLSHEEVQQQHRAMATAFGDQPTRVVQAARHCALALNDEAPRVTVGAAVTFAKDRNFEREAVVDERLVLRDALSRSMGDCTIDEIKTEWARRFAAAEFVDVQRRPGAAARTFTTREMVDLERDTIARMRAGQNICTPLVPAHISRDIATAAGHLSESQRAAVDQILASRDQILGLEGVAGAGKTTALSAVRLAAERAGCHVEGFAPTSRAAHRLTDAGIEATTLQHHLARPAPADQYKRLYVLDESSLASTRQMNAFLRGLQADDRVLLVGDVRQHQAVEAGRPYQQLQEAGMDVASLSDIIRQKDPALKEVVERLARADVAGAVQQLDAQGRVHEIVDRADRFNAIAREYVTHSEGMLVVSPDNQSRMELNEVIHRARQTAGDVDALDHRVRVLVPRQEITGADRQWAAQYRSGDVVRYTKGSRLLGLASGAYARVDAINVDDNQLTVQPDQGGRLTYDPRRLQGVTVYREAERPLAKGDRVQFTAPDRQRHIANRELGTIEKVDAQGEIQVRLDDGRTVTLNHRDRCHLDYGYAVTSHSSQGQTALRVLVHVETARLGENLVNRRFAYVAVSRGRFDAQIYTDDKNRLPETLGRESSHRAALEPAVARGLNIREASITRGI
jgi:conjugative relaxase-like TrwC/TraI family protein